MKRVSVFWEAEMTDMAWHEAYVALKCGGVWLVAVQ